MKLKIKVLSKAHNCPAFDCGGNVSAYMGIAGLFVDAKHERAKAYYGQFGFISLPEQLDNLFLPLSTIANTLDRLH